MDRKPRMDKLLETIAADLHVSGTHLAVDVPSPVAGWSDVAGFPFPRLSQG